MTPESEPPSQADLSQPGLPLGPSAVAPEAVAAVEALLFAAEAPLHADRLAELAGVSPTAVADVVDRLNREYQATGRTFRIHRIARGYQLYTVREFSDLVRKLYRRQLVQRLSTPALEILAIVAYKQPVTRPEIESLRGVDCSGPLVTLLERRLITTAGRARRPGSPFLYRTTREFLRYFGLGTLDELPPLEEFGTLIAAVVREGQDQSRSQEYLGAATESSARIPEPADRSDSQASLG